MNGNKKIITILLSLLIIISGLMVVVGNVSAEPAVGDGLEYVQKAINARDRGLGWLRESQLEDGSWSFDLGITALCVLTFLNAGYDETDTTVSSGIEYILQYVQPDGSISSGTYANYYTTAALLALSSTHNSEYDTIIKDATQFIIDIQIDENTPDDAYYVTKDDWRYGGIGYGGDGRPDLSNTQFALMALHAAESSVSDLEIPNEVWENALVFIDRCHNNIEFNDQAWAQDTTRPSYNDGGYIYFPTSEGSLAGGSGSYMSMTGAGIWSAVLCGVSPTDGRMQSALNWVSKRYTLEENVGFGQIALYYNYWSLARALVISQVKEIITGDGAHHNWFSELTDKLVSLQTNDGYWVNTESDWFWENIPEISTAYSILALETNILNSASKIKVDLKQKISDGADVKVYDSNGVEVGKKTKTGNSKSIMIDDASADTIKIEVVGKEGSDYTLEVTGSSGEREVAKKTYSGNIDSGEHQEVILVVSAVEGPVSFFGGDEPTTTVGGSAAASTDSMLLVISIIAVLVIIIGLGYYGSTRRKKRA